MHILMAEIMTDCTRTAKTTQSLSSFQFANLQDAERERWEDKWKTTYFNMQHVSLCQSRRVEWLDDFFFKEEKQQIQDVVK